MIAAIVLSSQSRIIAGVLLLTVLAIEAGGLFLLRVTGGDVPATDFQKAFFRAGHAHAGVLVTLALVSLILADSIKMSGILNFLARNGIWVSAILISAGFFLSAGGPGVKRPNRLIVLIYIGAVALGLGVLSLGIELLTS